MKAKKKKILEKTTSKHVRLLCFFRFFFRAWFRLSPLIFHTQNVSRSTSNSSCFSDVCFFSLFGRFCTFCVLFSCNRRWRPFQFDLVALLLLLYFSVSFTFSFHSLIWIPWRRRHTSLLCRELCERSNWNTWKAQLHLKHSNCTTLIVMHAIIK